MENAITLRWLHISANVRLNLFLVYVAVLQYRRIVDNIIYLMSMLTVHNHPSWLIDEVLLDLSFT